MCSFIYNYQFGAFNSRLGADKFPSSQQREPAGKRLISFVVFGCRSHSSRGQQKSSRFEGKNRELLPVVRRRGIEEAAARTILRWFR
jgi:hypothetical protein